MAYKEQLQRERNAEALLEPRVDVVLADQQESHSNDCDTERPKIRLGHGHYGVVNHLNPSAGNFSVFYRGRRT